MDGSFQFTANKLKGADIFLDEASVTATENAVMAASIAEGRTVIRNAASRITSYNVCYTKLLRSSRSACSSVASSKDSRLANRSAAAAVGDGNLRRPRAALVAGLHAAVRRGEAYP